MQQIHPLICCKKNTPNSVHMLCPPKLSNNIAINSGLFDNSKLSRFGCRISTTHYNFCTRHFYRIIIFRELFPAGVINVTK